MPKVERRKITRREWNALCKEVETCFLRLPKRKNILTLLFDLLTESELIMIARRLRIARALLLGHSYLEIRRDLGVGFDTIDWVHKWLSQNLKDYRKVLPDILEQAAEEGSKEKRIRPLPVDPNSFRGLRKYYPNSMLLFNLLLGDPEEYEMEP